MQSQTQPQPQQPPTSIDIAAALSRLNMANNTAYATPTAFAAFDTQFRAELRSEGLDIPRASMTPTQAQRYDEMLQAHDVIYRAANAAIQTPRNFSGRAVALFGLAAAVVTIPVAIGIRFGSLTAGLIAGAACLVAGAAAAGFILSPSNTASAFVNTTNFVGSAYTSIFTAVGAAIGAVEGSGYGGTGILVGALFGGGITYGLTRAFRNAPLVTPAILVCSVIGLSTMSHWHWVQSATRGSPIATGFLHGANDLNRVGGSVLERLRGCSSLTTPQNSMNGSSCPAVVAEESLVEGDNNGKPDRNNTKWELKGMRVSFWGTLEGRPNKAIITETENPNDTRWYIGTRSLKFAP